MIFTLKEIKDIVISDPEKFIYIMTKDSFKVIYGGLFCNLPYKFADCYCDSYDYTCAGDLILFI